MAGVWGDVLGIAGVVAVLLLDTLSDYPPALVHFPPTRVVFSCTYRLYHTQAYYVL